jgi:signal peptidase I
MRPSRALTARPAPRWLARLWWLAVAPPLLAALALRFLVPGRWEAEPGPWQWLGRLGDEHPVPLAIGLFLLFSLLIRQLAGHLPGGEHLVAEPRPRRPITWVVAIGVAAAAALALRATVGQPTQVTSASMLPTLEPFDALLLNKLAYGLHLPGTAHRAGRLPRRGEVLVFRGESVAEPAEKLIVKRVMGLPGDRVSTRAGLVTINGWAVPFCDAGRFVYLAHGKSIIGRLVVEYLDDQTFLTLHTPESGVSAPYLVKEGEVFVLGDNRNQSRDSRAWNGGGGAGVPLEAVEGRAWRIIGRDRAGHLDWHRLLRAPGPHPHFPGMDAREVEERIATCLQDRPARTWPPPAR